LDKQGISPPTMNQKPRFYYGYVVAAICFGIQMVGFGTFNSYGIFYLPLLAEFGWTRATLAGANSLSLIIKGSTGILMGSLNDRFGPRVVIAACGFFFGLGHLLMSQVNTVWQLYLFYGVIGIGISSVEVVTLSTVVRWFVGKRGMMSGIVKVGTGVGMLIFPLVMSALILGYGWRTAYVALGLLSLIFMISVSQFMRRDPGQKQQLADGEINTANLGAAERGLSLHEAIRTRQFWTICTVYLLLLFSAFAILYHIPVHAVGTGISELSAAGILSIIGGVSIAGRFVMGGVGDRLGNKRAIIICFIAFIAGFVWLQLAGELWMFYLFAAIYGFGHGGFFALFSPMVAEFFGTRSHGVIFGIVVCSGAIGGAIGPLLAGHIFDITQSYQIAFLIFLALSITGLLLTISLRPIIEGGTNEPRRST